MAGVNVVVVDMVVGHSEGLLPLGVTLSLRYLSRIQYFTRQRATPGNVPLALAAIRGTFHVYNNII